MTAMRVALAFIAMVAAAACTGDGHNAKERAGWEYRPERGVYGARVIYKFLDGEETNLVGTCRGEPAFFLLGGYYKPASYFKLTVDNQSWTLPLYPGTDGGGLSVSDHNQNLAISKAKRVIAFQVGDWRREVRPGSALLKFAADCR